MFLSVRDPVLFFWSWLFWHTNSTQCFLQTSRTFSNLQDPQINWTSIVFRQKETSFCSHCLFDVIGIWSGDFREVVGDMLERFLGRLVEGFRDMFGTCLEYFREFFGMFPDSFSNCFWKENTCIQIEFFLTYYIDTFFIFSGFFRYFLHHEGFQTWELHPRDDFLRRNILLFEHIQILHAELHIFFTNERSWISTHRTFLRSLGGFAGVFELFSGGCWSYLGVRSLDTFQRHVLKETYLVKIELLFSILVSYFYVFKHFRHDSTPRSRRGSSIGGMNATSLQELLTTSRTPGKLSKIRNFDDDQNLSVWA